MEIEIYELANKINASIKKEECFIKLDELDKELENNEEVIALAYKKDMASMKYNDLLKIYDENNDLVIKARKELSEAKYLLDTNPLVKKYLSYYAEAKKIIYEINQIIFNDFKMRDE